MADGKTVRHYSKEDKAEALRRYFAGEPPKTIVEDLGIPRKTFYNWVNAAKGNGTKEPRTRERDNVVPKVVPIEDGTETLIAKAQVPNYMECISIQYEYNKVQLQTAAINGYCEGMIVTADLLRDALAIEDTESRVYSTLAVLKERRQISDRIIKAFTDVSASSDEYQKIFGRLFGIEEAKE